MSTVSVSSTPTDTGTPATPVAQSTISSTSRSVWPEQRREVGLAGIVAAADVDGH